MSRAYMCLCEVRARFSGVWEYTHFENRMFYIILTWQQRLSVSVNIICQLSQCVLVLPNIKFSTSNMLFSCSCMPSVWLQIVFVAGNSWISMHVHYCVVQPVLQQLIDTLSRFTCGPICNISTAHLLLLWYWVTVQSVNISH